MDKILLLLIIILLLYLCLSINNNIETFNEKMLLKTQKIYKDNNECDISYFDKLYPDKLKNESDICIQKLTEYLDNKNINKSWYNNIKNCNNNDIKEYCNDATDCNYNSDCNNECCGITSQNTNVTCGTEQCLNYSKNSDNLICSNINECRDSNGKCGTGLEYCNNQSIYTKCNNINECRNSSGICGKGEQFCNTNSLYKPCINQNINENDDYIQYNIVFPKYNKINTKIGSNEALKQQYVNICIPKNIEKPPDGYPFIILFEFQDNEGCLEKYYTQGQSGMFNPKVINAFETSNPDIIDSRIYYLYDILDDLLKNGIAVVFFPDYNYDNRYYFDCDPDNYVGYFSNNYVGKNINNSCYNNGNNPDIYLLNMLIWNIYYWNINSPEPIINPTMEITKNETSWPVNKEDIESIPQEYIKITKIDDFKNIHLDLNSVGIWGYSVGTLIVSKLIREFHTLKIWQTIDKYKYIESRPKLKLAILVGGGTYNCFKYDTYGKLLNGYDSSSPNCFPNTNYSENPHNTNFCKLRAHTGFTGCCPMESRDDAGFDCENIFEKNCSNVKNDVFKCTSCIIPIADSMPECIEHAPKWCDPQYKQKIYGPHPPTLMLSTLCDNFTDINWQIKYKESFKDTEIYNDIIDMYSNPGLSGKPSYGEEPTYNYENELSLHGIVKSQVEPLKQFIRYYMIEDIEKPNYVSMRPYSNPDVPDEPPIPPPKNKKECENDVAEICGLLKIIKNNYYYNPNVFNCLMCMLRSPDELLDKIKDDCTQSSNFENICYSYSVDNVSSIKPSCNTILDSYKDICHTLLDESSDDIYSILKDVRKSPYNCTNAEIIKYCKDI